VRAHRLGPEPAVTDAEWRRRLTNHVTPKPSFGFKGIMGPTSKLKILGGRRASVGKCRGMVMLDESTLGTSASRDYERALAAATSPHLTLDPRRNVAARTRG